MEPSGHRIDQAWLSDRPATAVMAALHSGDAGTARFVGGCVRDALAGRPVRDVDIATDLPPEMVMTRLEKAQIRVIPTGLKHGTVTAIANHRPFEITTLRVDVETDGRRATVAFTDDWVADASRRDFTMNGLYCDPDGRVYDPVGGVDDLAAGRVRFIGDPTQRIVEDALRILRFFRFHAWFGRGEMDMAGLAACRDRQADIDSLSIERVQAELRRLLQAPNPLSTLHTMNAVGIMAHVLPEAIHLDRLAVLMEWNVDDPLLRLAVLTDRRAETLTGLGTRLKLSNKEKTRLRCMASGEVDVPPDMDTPTLHAQAYWLGVERLCDLALLDGACDGRDRTAMIRALAGWDRPVFPLSGADLIRLNIPRGPALGDMLRRLESWWVDQNFEPDRQALRLHLATLVDGE